jgi:hypothetical protein
MRVDRNGYTQAYDGQWNTLPTRLWKIRCCDCGLVHLLELRVHKGKVQFKADRDMRATAQVRRRLVAQGK